MVKRAARILGPSKVVKSAAPSALPYIFRDGNFGRRMSWTEAQSITEGLVPGPLPQMGQ
jgi:hypothetical protein